MCPDDATTNELREQLRQSQLAIEEMNHRFRNQLQMISNLLDIQAAKSSNSEVLDAMRQCRARVGSIAIVQDMLRPGASAGIVKVDEYLAALASVLGDSWGGQTTTIKISVHAAKVSLTPARAAVVGLIVTELVANAFKHAFRKGTAGRVTIELAQSGGLVGLSVEDDGCGLPVGISIASVSTGGLRLTRSLAEQLKGQIELASGNGTKITVVFPV
jgi:two-component sensor histidine kinase